jgi:hypothetical protein
MSAFTRKPRRPLSRRWSHRGVGGYLILADIRAPELPRLQQRVLKLVAFQKSTSGRVIETDRVIREVMELEALPANSKEKAT